MLIQLFTFNDDDYHFLEGNVTILEWRKKRRLRFLTEGKGTNIPDQSLTCATRLLEFVTFYYVTIESITVFP